MGKFDGKFLRGAIGPSVFKKYRDMQVVQGKSKKKKFKRTKATKKAATVFGKASSLASSIRSAFTAAISNLYDGTMIYRFTTDVVFSLRTSLDVATQKFNFTAGNFNRLNGFEFNIGSPLKNLFFAQPQIIDSGSTIQVNIPEMNIPQDLRFPQSTKYCKLIVLASFFDLQNGYYKKAITQIFNIDYNYSPSVFPPQQWSFERESGCLCVIAINLQYYEKTFAGNAVINNKSFNPCAILTAFITEGAINPSVTKKWTPMSFKTN